MECYQNVLINMFQEAIASGKKLFMYLDDLSLISRQLLLTFALYKKDLRFGGSFSLRQEGDLLFKML